VEQILKDLHIDLRVIPAMVVGFWVLYWLLTKLLFAPLQKFLDERQRVVNANLSDAEHQKQEMEKARAEYEKRLEGIEAEARVKIQEAIKEAQVAKEEILTDARGRADEVKRSAAYEIEREKEKAMVELRDRVAELSIAAAGKVLEETLDERRHRKLIQDFIAELEKA
jgi:F-type H+-transporting ATPase subunit b